MRVIVQYAAEKRDAYFDDGAKRKPSIADALTKACFEQNGGRVTLNGDEVKLTAKVKDGDKVKVTPKAQEGGLSG